MKPRGRPRKQGERARNYSVRLYPREADAIRTIGSGDFTAGVRRLLAQATGEAIATDTNHPRTNTD